MQIVVVRGLLEKDKVVKIWRKKVRVGRREDVSFDSCANKSGGTGSLLPNTRDAHESPDTRIAYVLLYGMLAGRGLGWAK
jgi:hypothetical protein